MATTCTSDGARARTAATVAAALTSAPVYTMAPAAAAASSTDWKTALLRGHIDPAIATAAGHELIPGRQVAAVDATGAGDAFTGALLAELSRGVPLARAARFANAAAALSTLGYGAIAPLPRRAAVASALGPAD